MHFLLAVMIAVGFWHARGVEIPCHPVAVIVDDSQLPQQQLPWYPSVTVSALAAAFGPGSPRCGQILMGQTMLAYRTQDPRTYFWTIAHELGHVAGLPHTADGLMSADSGYTAPIPWRYRPAGVRSR